MEKEYYIKVNEWTKVLVTEEIYHFYRRQQWKEAKRRKVRANMECSYELMVESGIDGKCASKQKFVEDIVMDKLLQEMLIEALDTIALDERELIYNIYFCNKSERELSKFYGISNVAINKKHHKIVLKLKKYLIFKKTF